MNEVSTHGRVAVAGLHGIALILLALQAITRSLPPTPDAIPAPESAEAAWWGFWPVTYLPAGWFWAGAAVVVLLMAWGWWMLLRHEPAGSASNGNARGDAILRRMLPLLGLALLASFFAFPIVHTRWGDAYILNRTIAWPNPDLRLTHSWQAPLDVWLHSQVWLWGQERYGWVEAMPVYRILSPLAGLLYLGALLGLSRDRAFAPGWLTFGLLASLALLQQFYGYIENYSFAAAGILTFIWLGHRVLLGKSPLWLAALALGVTNATHPSTVVLAPALLYLGWVRYQANPRGTAALRPIVLAVTMPMLAAAGGTILLMEVGGHGLVALFTIDRPGGGDASWFVPLFETTTRWESYTLFSWLHIRDLLNQQALVAPVVLTSLVWLALWRRWAQVRGAVTPVDQATLHFVSVAALGHLLLITVWNPDYGGQRDWDLFSLHAVTTALWLAAYARHTLREDRLLLAGFVPLIALQAFQTAAFIYQNTLPWEWP